MSKHTETKRLPINQQRSFYFMGEPGVDRGFTPGALPVQSMAIFDRGNRCNIWIGNVRLEDYLKTRGFGWVIEMEEILAATDATAFIKAYKFGGRPPIHPRIMLGLIIFGMLTRRSSLRELEEVAQSDARAWYLTGGLQPDHSTIGKFINRHAKILTDEYFITLTKEIVNRLGIRAGDAAFDGTIVESAASYFNTVKKEAAMRDAAELAKEATERPDDTRIQKQADVAKRVAEVIDERIHNRKVVGKPSENVRVARTDPDAVVQPRKDGVTRPAYKPSVVATKERLIAGQIVHPSSETEVVQCLVEQHTAVLSGNPKTSLLDAGYNSGPMLRFFVEADMNVLCPAGKAKGETDFQKASDKQIPKSDFQYDDNADLYVCPKGFHLLPARRTESDAHGRTYRKYQTQPAVCAHCPLREKCTNSVKGRSLKRYSDEEYKEAMNIIFNDSRARCHYRKRQGMVEPVFSVLRERQGLRRFHRRGLLQVAAEFALHCIAYNLKRAVQLKALAAASGISTFIQLLLSFMTVSLAYFLRRPWWHAQDYAFCSPTPARTAT